VRTWELKGGVSAQVTAVELELGDGRTEKLVVRRHGSADLSRDPAIAAHELRLLELLEAAGVCAPRPRYLDAAGEIFGTPCLVVDYVEGDDAPADESAVVGGLAEALVEIHRLDCATIDFLPERVRTPMRNPHVLLHGDFWPGNTLWRDGRLVAVIDWEDAAVGDPLADVANARLELLWALGLQAMDDFTRRYETATAVDLADLPDWDLWAGRRLGSHMAGWSLDHATADAMRSEHETFMARALARLAETGREP
jgi:aminoglycoside phosphotransferase (APT) family kinase protein